MDERVLVPRGKQKSYKAIRKREDLAYDNLSEMRMIVVLDGLVTFCQHFKYFGTWLSFSLCYNHDAAKRLAAVNASMWAMYKVWDDDHVDTYSNYMLFRAIPCNLLLRGREIWALSKYLLAYLKVFLHRGIRSILKINMGQVINRHIKNSSIREMFYNILTV